MRLLNKIEERIVLLIADSNYTIIQTISGKKYTSSYSLYVLEKKLGFLRTSRSVSICPSTILSIKNNKVITPMGEFVISRRKTEKIHEKISNLYTPAFCDSYQKQCTNTEVI